MCLADKMDVSGLEPIEQTALLTEYCRALDSRAARPILGDFLADSTVSKIDFDFASLAASPSVVALVALRAKMLDERIRGFILENPRAVIVDIGAGLNSVAFRVDPPSTVDWYSVDLPGVIAVREALMPRGIGDRTVAASLLQPGWADTIPTGRPTMVVADGLIAFLNEAEVITILRGITGHFGTGVVAFNDYGPVSKANQLMGRLATARKTNSPHSQWRFPGFKDARYPESWNCGLALLDEASVMQQPETGLFPSGLRLASRLSHRVPAIARKARILQYRF
ncbi:putative O-methyltransferase Omt [Mycolicibacterium cyprinidarum]|uniref:O-methyltransferase Omt n=1 Tax=Mycolicibacterium cyprinidarum TaxID=2860311 RepID=A0ABQ4VAS8_9MYCO|nr:putative O-methyltransferase Omt [Mycolicibacterium sp. NGTWS0302]GJF17017.1 putative O-methyltransferase Omt [Mycolicibacterium sp. NGTWSNA01]GJF18042.1 putative O-methyltransferase Omt [Mycolicibacterium sp. NGTWS1803]